MNDPYALAAFWHMHDHQAHEARQVAEIQRNHSPHSHANYALRELVGMDRAAFFLFITDRHVPGPRLEELAN